MGSRNLLTKRKAKTGAAGTIRSMGGSAGGGALRMVPGVRDGAVWAGEAEMRLVRKVGAR